MQTPQKKEYDKGYSAGRYADFRARKTELSRSVFGGKCFLCGKTDGFENYHLHHVEYHPEDSSYARSSKALWTRLLRVKEAEEHPERFRLLCQPCHRMVTSLGTYVLRYYREPRITPGLDTLVDLLGKEIINRQFDGFDK